MDFKTKDKSESKSEKKICNGEAKKEVPRRFVKIRRTYPSENCEKTEMRFVVYKPASDEKFSHKSVLSEVSQFLQTQSDDMKVHQNISSSVPASTATSTNTMTKNSTVSRSVAPTSKAQHDWIAALRNSIPLIKELVVKLKKMEKNTKSKDVQSVMKEAEKLLANIHEVLNDGRPVYKSMFIRIRDVYKSYQNLNAERSESAQCYNQHYITETRMNAKETFFASPSEQQTTFFDLHKNYSHLAELLQEELKFKQYRLYEEWVKEKTQSRHQSESSDFEMLPPDSSMSAMMNLITKRMDAMGAIMEQKLGSLEKNCFEKLSSLEKKLDEKEQALIETTTAEPSFNMDEATAVKWIIELRNRIVNGPRSHKENNATRDNFQTLFQIMNKFHDKNGINWSFAKILSELSPFKPTLDIVASTPEYLALIIKMNEEYPTNDNLVIIVAIAENESWRKNLLKPELLGPLLTRLAVDRMDTCDIAAAQIIVRLLELPNEEFRENLKKDEIENKLIESLDKFAVGRCKSVVSPWYLERIMNGTKAQRYFSAWMIANEPLTVREAGAIPILRIVVSNSNTEPYSKKHAEIALDTFKHR